MKQFDIRKRLLENADIMCLTEDTVKNLLKQLLVELEKEENYEECARLKAIAENHINIMKDKIKRATFKQWLSKTKKTKRWHCEKFDEDAKL